VSPILVRPVREQLEHDRIIRQLQAKFRRKHEVAINPAAEQNTPIGTGPSALYPDVLLMSLDRGHKPQAIVEVETGESVNHLEALAQWAHFSRVRLPFHLYVPAGMVDVARRLCEDNNIYVSEIWSYHAIGDQMRFTLVHRTKEAPPAPPKKPAAPKKPAPPKAAPPKAPLPKAAPAKAALPKAALPKAAPAKAAPVKTAPAKPAPAKAAPARKKKPAAKKPVKARKRK
jgi:hypothetical protein